MALSKHDSKMDLKTGNDLLSLAQDVAATTQVIVQALEKQKLPLPSLAADGPSPDCIPTNDVDLQKLRNSVVFQARLLADTFTGPRKYLQEQICISETNSMVWKVIYNFDIPKHVPLDATISFADLSEACGLAVDKLVRILRCAMLHHFFTEPVPNQVGHSAVSRLLATEQINMDFLGTNVEDFLPGCVKEVDALKSNGDSTDPHDCGFTLAHGDGKTLYFDYLAADPARVRRFGGNQELMGSAGAHGAVGTLLTGYDWRGLGKAKVVDVGGSLGHTAIDLAQHAPELQLVVQDLPEVIETAKSRRDVSAFAGQLEFQAHSFFEPQPIRDADAYLFRLIFHDWPREKAVEILSNLVPSMRSGSRLIVNEFVLLPPGQGSPYMSKIARAVDMLMMVTFNARERDLQEWVELADVAAPGQLELEQAGDFIVVFRKV